MRPATRLPLSTLLIVLLVPTLASAEGWGRGGRCRVDCRLAGQLVDYTCNQGHDLRIWSDSLQQKRDLYVYLPPNYDCNKRYPLMIYLHGILQDETGFVKHILQPLDRAIQCGQLPPMIVAAPDGSLTGRQSLHDAGSFFINSCVGNFEDWIMKDVWNFMRVHYPIRPEREAHILAGVSMGGFGAYNLALKHRDQFRIVIGILPVLNLRWVDCCCDYMGDFDPCCWGWRTSNDNPREVLGRFMHGLIKVRMAQVMYPVFGRGPAALAKASLENPIEMIDRLHLQNGELDIYIGYAGRDEFNLDAHAESFLYVLKHHGIDATVDYRPCGQHNERTAVSMIPPLVPWLADRLRCLGLNDER